VAGVGYTGEGARAAGVAYACFSWPMEFVPRDPVSCALRPNGCLLAGRHR